MYTKLLFHVVRFQINRMSVKLEDKKHNNSEKITASEQDDAESRMER